MSEALATIVERLPTIREAKDAEWELKKLRHYRDVLFALAPFQVGDKATLIGEVSREASLSYRAIAAPGRKVQVKEIDHRPAGFTALVFLVDDPSPERPAHFTVSQARLGRCP